MKYTMNDGTVVEGTPEEIATFLKAKERNVKAVSTATTMPVAALIPTHWVAPAKTKKVRGDSRHCKSWTRKEKIELKRLFKQGMTPKQIETMLDNGRKENSIYQVLQRMGLKNKAHNYPSTRKPREKSTPPVISAEFPEFTTVPLEYQQIMRDITNATIRNNGSMSFIKDGVAFGIAGVKAWSEFAQEFMTRAWQVASHFNVENKWSFSNHELRYGQ